MFVQLVYLLDVYFYGIILADSTQQSEKMADAFPILRKQSTILISQLSERSMIMESYVCTLCGWVYNEEDGAPEYGIAPGTKWEDVPEDFVCPLCGATKDMFDKN